VFRSGAALERRSSNPLQVPSVGFPRFVRANEKTAAPGVECPQWRRRMMKSLLCFALVETPYHTRGAGAAICGPSEDATSAECICALCADSHPRCPPKNSIGATRPPPPAGDRDATLRVPASIRRVARDLTRASTSELTDLHVVDSPCRCYYCGP